MAYDEFSNRWNAVEEAEVKEGMKRYTVETAEVIRVRRTCTVVASSAEEARRIMEGGFIDAVEDDVFCFDDVSGERSVIRIENVNYIDNVDTLVMGVKEGAK